LALGDENLTKLATPSHKKNSGHHPPCYSLHIFTKKIYIKKILTMPINSRTKGASYERDIVKILNKFFLKNNFNFICKRNLDQYQEAGQADISGFPYHSIECKHYKEGNWYKPDWWRQVCTSADAEGTIPVLIFKFNRVPTRVAIPLHAINPDFEVDNQKIAVMSMDAWLDVIKSNWSTYKQKKENGWN
jgi:Holliday junction resolvase